MENIITANNPASEPSFYDVVSFEDCFDIVEDDVRKKYLSRLSEMEIVPVEGLSDLEMDLIRNVRLYKIKKMVYQKGEAVLDKFTTVFNTISTYNASVFLIIDSDGSDTDLYLGVRNADPDDYEYKKSTVTLGDTLKKALVGHFPGSEIESKDRRAIAKISKRIEGLDNVAAVSVAGNSRSNWDAANEQFVQGLEKLILAMSGRSYIGLLIASSTSPNMIQVLRKRYQQLYTNLSPYQKLSFSTGKISSTSRSESFFEMNPKKKAAMIGSALASVAFPILGSEFDSRGKSYGGLVGSAVAGQLCGLINSLAPVNQIANTENESVSSVAENKSITGMLSLLDNLLDKTEEFEAYGMWNVAGYFISEDMSSAEMAACNYRSLMNGDMSGREVSAVNSWRRCGKGYVSEFSQVVAYLSRFTHPRFNYGGSFSVDASTAVSGRELGLHLGLPRVSVPGFPVIEHAEFGKEVVDCNLIGESREVAPENRITIGRVYDSGKSTSRVVELNNDSLNMHTFVTGSTGSGKSNVVYQILSELRQDGIPFLVIEPAKGEYKNAFGKLPGVNVFSTNPSIAPLIGINPFMFPASVHVLEHIDGLVEIFNVCWPMHDAMPAFLKDAILRSYEKVGWDLALSVNEGKRVRYPDFEILAEQLNALIDNSQYANEVKSNYKGALLTRVRSLSVGLNKLLFSNEETPYSVLFDKNCILDLSRVKSAESKALLMGFVIFALNEYREDQKVGSNAALRHVTVLEEAHNILKNTNDHDSRLIGKSVEMLTNTIAEIRTYGEGFIIVDQSPSAVDIAAIKNTNTKIVLRTPEGNDRNTVGMAMGLNHDQIDEIAKLPSGVAAVYQNDWLNPVLVHVNKANVSEEPYVCGKLDKIKPVKAARSEIVRMLLSGSVHSERVSGKDLRASLKRLEVDCCAKSKIDRLIDDYVFSSGVLVWSESEVAELRPLLSRLFGLGGRDKRYTLDDLRKMISDKSEGLSAELIDETANIMFEGK